MEQLQVFSHDEFGSVRTLLIGNEPYFVGKDVTDILGYSNSRDALSRHVAEEDRDAVGIHDAIGREQLTVFINESGLYSLILSSKLPAAKRFKHWITSEVLPAIRKHGVYAVDEVLNNPDLLLSALEALKQEREAARSLQETVDAQQELLTVMEPKAVYYETILYTDQCGDTHPYLFTKWTQKGRLMIYELMKAAGYEPKEDQVEEEADGGEG